MHDPRKLRHSIERRKREKQEREGVPQEKERLVKDDQGSDETVHTIGVKLIMSPWRRRFIEIETKKKKKCRRRGRVSVEKKEEKERNDN